MPKQIATRRPAAAIAPDSTFGESTFRLLPPFALALALNGFFVYLAVLDVVGRAPRTATTAAWYACVGLLCLAGAWLSRATLLDRLARRPRPTVAYVLAGTALAGWFLLNVLLLTHGSLPRTFAALLVLWTLPAALLALSLPREAIERVAAGIAALALVFLAIEIAVLVESSVSGTRFSPIAYLDPISAAQIPALGAVALLALRGATVRRELVRGAGVLALVAATVLPGSRGPILAVVAASVLLAALARDSWRIAVPALVAGFALGLAGTAAIGSSYYLTYSLPGVRTGSTISTMTIRREWWTTAVAAIPDEPIVGHGVAMFVDETPEAHRMGVAGQRTYPHNSPLESIYSLGVLGAIPYAVYLAAAVAALVLLARRAGSRTILLAAGLWVFAFVGANLSGEIGADAVLWAAGALSVGLYADTTARR